MGAKRDRRDDNYYDIHIYMYMCMPLVVDWTSRRSGSLINS